MVNRIARMGLLLSLSVATGVAAAGEITTNFAAKTVERVARSRQERSVNLNIDRANADSTYIRRSLNPLRLAGESLIDAYNFFNYNVPGFIESYRSNNYTFIHENGYNFYFSGVVTESGSQTQVPVTGFAYLIFKETNDPMQVCHSAYAESMTLSYLDPAGRVAERSELKGGGYLQCVERERPARD